MWRRRQQSASGSGDSTPPVVPRPDSRSDLQRQFDVGLDLVLRGEETHNLGSLDAGIGILGRLLPSFSMRDPNLVECLILLGFAHLARFGLTGNAEDIPRAIDHAERALGVLPAPGPLIALARAYRALYDRTSMLRDLESCISANEQAVELISAGNPYRARLLSALGSDYRTLFEATTESSHLDKSIDRQERAIAALPTDHPHRFLL